jgi:hypothetical protein
MANYTGIQGQNILIVDTDPANPVEGQIWYNSTSNLLKGYQFTPDVWVSGGNMGSSRYGTSAAGTATATLAIGGYGGSPESYLTAVEKYNGTTWSPTGSLNQSSNFGGAGFGTQTAAVAVAGFQQPISPANLNFTENFNGSTWTNQGAYSYTGPGLAGVGVQTAGLAFCGFGSDPTSLTSASTYNGSTWTVVPATLGTARYSVAGAGTQTAALAFGGQIPGSPNTTAATESYNGTSWTAGGNLNNSRRLLAGCGTQTAALAVGGNPPTTGTEKYNGSTWAISPAVLSTGRQNGAGVAGTQTLAIVFGSGPAGALTNTTEVFTSGGFSTKTITTS